MMQIELNEPSGGRLENKNAKRNPTVESQLARFHRGTRTLSSLFSIVLIKTIVRKPLFGSQLLRVWK